jgi:hypothetical protein
VSLCSPSRTIENSKIRDMVVDRGTLVHLVEGMEVVAR